MEVGADYTLSNTHENTPLISSMSNGGLTTVKEILDHLAAEPDKLRVGAFLNAKNALGRKVLVEGADRDLAEIVKT